MNFAKNNPSKKNITELSQKTCEIKGCNNIFKVTQNKKYCDDPKCKSKRIKKYNLKKTTHNYNLIIPRNKKLIGKKIILHCSAKNKTHRCKNKYTIIYNIDRKIYPKYCEKHRNEYRRKIFENKGL